MPSGVCSSSRGRPQSHQLDFAVQAAVGVQHTHAVVIAGDILLQNQFVLVAAAVNGGGDGVKFFAVIGKEHLFLVGKVQFQYAGELLA